MDIILYSFTVYPFKRELELVFKMHYILQHSQLFAFVDWWSFEVLKAWATSGYGFDRQTCARRVFCSASNSADVTEYPWQPEDPVLRAWLETNPEWKRGNFASGAVVYVFAPEMDPICNIWILQRHKCNSCTEGGRAAGRRTAIITADNKRKKRLIVSTPPLLSEL